MLVRNCNLGTGESEGEFQAILVDKMRLCLKKQKSSSVSWASVMDTL